LSRDTLVLPKNRMIDLKRPTGFTNSIDFSQGRTCGFPNLFFFRLSSHLSSS